MTDLENNNNNSQKILCLAFNQDSSCFACGTENGFVIYDSDPVRERFRQDNIGGAIGIVEMLFKSNILALVGSTSKAISPPNMVKFWDDYQSKFFAELEFKVPVRAVKLKRERVVVVTDKVIYVYSFSDLSVITQHDTILNPNGLCSISTDKNDILVCPGLNHGEVRVDLYDLEMSYTLQAHNNELTQLVLNLDGSLLATTSEKGTLVRIWNTETKSMQREFRRGIKEAKIYSLAFSKNSNYLCVCSDTGTIHLYSLDEMNNESNKEEQDGDGKIKNKQSKLSFMKGMLPKYFSSEWSFAQFTIPIEPNEKYFCAFGKSEESIIVITTNGKYYKYQVDLMKNQIVPIGEAKF